MHFTFNCSRKIRCFYTNILLQASSTSQPMPATCVVVQFFPLVHLGNCSTSGLWLINIQRCRTKLSNPWKRTISCYTSPKEMAIRPCEFSLLHIHWPQNTRKLWYPKRTVPSTGQMDGIPIPVWCSLHLYQRGAKHHHRYTVQMTCWLNKQQSRETCYSTLPCISQQWRGLLDSNF